MITFSRKITPTSVLKDGEVVGRIIKPQNCRNAYVLSLTGKVWRNGIAYDSKIKGGCIASRYKTLKQAKESAIKYA